MAVQKGLLNRGFKLPTCEKHFHDHDETWLILAGSGTGYWIDHDGRREEFDLETGDAWMIPAGYEHGSDGLPQTGQNSDDFTIASLIGTQPPGCHEWRHYYVEKEGYIPSLQLKKTPTNRYRHPAKLPAQMRTITFTERGKAAIQDDALPVLGPHKVLCKSLYSGISNGTERNVMLGGNYSPKEWPTRFGYQNVGRVVEVGEAVTCLAPGDVIFSGAGLFHVEFFAAIATPEKLLIKLPAEVEPRDAALFGVAGVAMHHVRRTDVRLGERVLVIGAGLIGQLTAQAARLAGAQVTVCDLNARRLAVAQDLGAHFTIQLTTESDSWDTVRAAGPFDVVFEDSGAPVLDHTIGTTFHSSRADGVLSQRGRVVMAAGRERVDYSFNGGQGVELVMHHVSHFDGDDLRQVCRFTADGDLKIAPLIQDVVKIDDAPMIYDRLVNEPDTLFGTVFDWQ